LNVVNPYVVFRGGAGGYKKGETHGAMAIAWGMDLVSPPGLSLTVEGFVGPWNTPSPNLYPAVGVSVRVGLFTRE